VRRSSHRISRDSWKVVNQRDRLLSGQLFNEAGLTRWHANGMTRTRVSTTVNEELLASARRLRPGLTIAALMDEALEALLARHRSAVIDASYASYEEHPLDEPDEWGNLAEFRQATAAS
jgi:hypothetical protein